MSAVFSECRTWRYMLWRNTEHAEAAFAAADALPDHQLSEVSLSTVAFIGLNPSTADEVVNDPTVRRCVGYATRWGFERLMMLNAFAYRATDPRKLRMVPRDEAIGPDNDRHLILAARRADLIVCCWGTHAKLGRRGEAVAALLDGRRELHVLGLTKDGHPKHPLYLRGDLRPVPWDGYAFT